MTSISRLAGLTQSVAIKAPCRVATTAAIAELTGLLTIDGVVTAAGDRVLVKDQANPINNGIYAVDTGAWSRDVDFKQPSDCAKGTIVLVTSGTVNASTVWELTTTAPVIGTSSLAFSPTSAAALQFASAFMISTFLPAASAAAARTVLDVPATAGVVLKSLVDAEGDLIVGTGPDTVGRLARGAVTQLLGVVGTALSWVQVNLATMVTGLLPTANLPDGTIVGRSYTEYTANANLSTNIPADDTIPQNTEGTQVFSVSYTPQSTTNRLLVILQSQVATNGAADQVCAALFLNANAGATVSSWITTAASQYMTPLPLVYEYVPGSVSAQTLAIRVGGNGTTVRMNGTVAGRFGGGTARATLTILEIKAS